MRGRSAQNRWGRLWNRLTEPYVVGALAADPDLRRRAELCLAMAYVGLVFAPIYAVVTLAQGAWFEGLVGLAMASGGLAVPFLLRRTRSLRILANYGAGLYFAALVAAAFGPQGFGLPAVMASVTVPMVALLIGGARPARFWVIVVLGQALFYFWLDARGGAVRPPQGEHRVADYVAVLCFILLVFGMSVAFEWSKTLAMRARETAEEERMRVEVLRVQAEEEAKLLRANRMASVGQLAAGVAHELNNPLTYVLANLEYARRELPAISAEVAEALDDAVSGAQRMGEIVADLTTFARADPEVVSEVDLAAAMGIAIKMARNQIRHRALLDVETEETRVRGDETRFIQVFLNLLVNAAQSFPEDASPAHAGVFVTVRAWGGMGVVEVRDTGCGIPEEHLQKVTQPFFTTKPVGKGTGLGLSVCANVVKNYGGTLEVASVVGEGTTVRVKLPLLEARAEEGSAAPVDRGTSADVDAPARVLVIDDEPLVLSSLSRTLRAHRVTLAPTGAEGVRHLLGGEKFDVVLCDLMMPDVDGAEVYRRVLRDRPELARCFVFLSGGALSPSTERFLAEHDIHLLQKPYDAGQLVRTVRAIRAGEDPPIQATWTGTAHG